MKKIIIFSSIILIFLFSGCADIATKDEVDAVKEKINNVEDDFYVMVKQVNEKFQNIENDYNQKINKINSETKEISDKLLILNSEIDSLKEEVRGVKGKIDELKYEIDEKLKKITDDYIEKNLDTKRDIEGLKKTYNDLIITTSNLNQHLSIMQKDIIVLRDSQVKILEGIQNFPQRIEQIEEEINKNEKNLQNLTQTILEELTKHESEIYYLKQKVSTDKELGKEEKKDKQVKSILKTEKGNYYIVQKGDYLTKIAQKFNTSVSEIKKLNNLKSDTVYPGQKLLIP